MNIEDIPFEPEKPKGADAPDKGVVDKKVTKNPATKKPAAKKPAFKKPSPTKPATKKPASKTAETKGLKDAAPKKLIKGAPAKSSDGDGTPLTAVPIGTRINNNYEIEELVSTGGMGEVYRGVNFHTGDRVAIKIVLPTLAHDEKIIQLFRREARILGKLSDEAIVRYLNFVKDEKLGRFCLIMEFVDGIPLSDMMEQTGALSLQDVKLLIWRMATGLNCAHEMEITHRDLSPDNVIVEDGKLHDATLIDFGIAKSTKITEGTLHGQFAGKFNFVSPEQLGHFDGIVDARSDIYSLGLMAAGAAIGKPLPMGATVVDAVQSRAGIPDLSAVYPELQPLLSYMMEPNPANRPATMADVARMVDNPSLVPAQYHPGGADMSAKSTTWRKVISSMITTPPQVQSGTPVSVPPMNSVFPYSTNNPGVSATGARLSPSPDTSVIGQQTVAPRPEPLKRGKLVGISFATILVGGIGFTAVLGLGPFGAGDDKTKTINEEVAVAPSETRPSPDPIPEPVAPDPEPESGPKPEEPIRERTPSDIGSQLAWLEDYITGDCVYHSIRSTDGEKVSIEGLAASAAPFEILLKDFEAANGVEPDIGLNLVRDSQCPVLDFVARLDQSSATAPVLKLDTDVLNIGDTLSGNLSGVLGRPVYLFLVSGKGGTYNLTSLLQPEPDGSQSFRFGMNSAGEDGSVPQMIVAVTTRSQLVTANAARDGADVAALMPIIGAEIQTTGSEAAASVQYFQLDN